MTEDEAAEVMTVEGAWALYDLQERELWDEYAADPNYLHGQAYLGGERLMRRRCERTVERIRYQREDARVNVAR